MEFAEIKTWSSFDTLIVGAGVWGCALARRYAEAGKRVLVLEKRTAIGGNVRRAARAVSGRGCEDPEPRRRRTPGAYKYFDMDKSIDAALKVDIR